MSRNQKKKHQRNRLPREIRSVELKIAVDAEHIQTIHLITNPEKFSRI